MQRTLAILVGGGPAPGINAVVEAATLAARAEGWRVLGIPWGFSRLMLGETALARELDETAVAGIAVRGGSVLHTSRANPTKDPATLARVVRSLETLGVTDLVTIGGDDTASSALRVATEAGGRVRVVHVPKTIDNDLPLPRSQPTFGFETAKHLGSRLVRNLAEDARTTGRWYLVTAMGRTAGHLALAMGVGGGAALTVIPEEFAADRKIRVADLAGLVEAAVLKRLAAGERHGVAVLAEGLLDRLPPEDVADLASVERDEHGHPRLSEISLGKVLRDVLGTRLKQRGIDTSFVAKEIGYELRCEDPVAHDVQYARGLGVGAVRLLAAGASGVLVALVHGELTPIPFGDIRDPATGRVRVRLVDASGDAWRHALALQARLRPRDLEGESLKRLAEASRESPEALVARLSPHVLR
ncbi:MAG TPA: 6-phosphofructokinase [Candidatus Thermoplasmatota archaeon]|nr:6-phosphofructokinase [Candidatus Thermoplasmatota archaeon]